MKDFNCNFLRKKRRMEFSLFDSEKQDRFSTNFNSSVLPSPIPFQSPQINEDINENSFLSNSFQMILPHNTNEVDADSLDFNNDFNFKYNEKENLIDMQKNTFINIFENIENSYMEIIECVNILTQIKEKNFIGILINNQKGRKTNEQKTNGIKGKHNKYSPDNMLRKAKVIVFEAILQTINSILINIDVNKKLKILKNEQVKELKVSYNKELLNTKIKDIYSKEISSKYVVDSDYNEKMIKSIYEEKEKYTEVIKILEKTLEECFQDFRDKENENKLKEMLKKIIDIRLQKETNEYKNDVMDTINDFVKIFRETKKSRSSKKLNKNFEIECI